MNDITSLQLDIDLFLNGEFSVSTSASGGLGVDVRTADGRHVATFENVNEADFWLFAS